MELPLCRHIKTNGIRCKAPSLTGGLGVTSTNASTVGIPHTASTMPREAISCQANTSSSPHWKIANPFRSRSRSSSGDLETKRATALLYGLQLAINNARDLRTDPFETVLSADSSPEGIDLAEPDIFEPAPTLYFAEALEEELDREDEEYRKELMERFEARMRANSNSEAQSSDAAPASEDRLPE